jgi:hypothetical protein
MLLGGHPLHHIFLSTKKMHQTAVRLCETGETLEQVARDSV